MSPDSEARPIPTGRRARSRPSFGAGLAAGIAGGTLASAALAVGALMILPSDTLDALRGKQADAPPQVETSPSPTPTPIPTDAWLDSDTTLPIEVTQPGTVVAFGEPAIVQIAGTEGSRTLVEITTTTIEAAPEKDQTSLRRAAPMLTGQTVYYARMFARWVAGDSLDDTLVGELFVMLDAEGVVIPSITLLDWPACSSPATPPNFTTASEPTEWCVAAASPTAGLVPVSLHFSQAGGPYDSPDGGAGVRWSQ